ncbi:FmdE protein associated with molybdenum formylmethanofuran dehydrogenase [Brockia lithotrophica]|uniref:FmdE protein associated with molybdenum formylmethanofuran dehydrogenase n=2 Tax=Brockia lithotrophica TaxID=933949 RepID=A0A660L723_9BACL|nr:FmdE protein associated with molybdenum formylmethanofuran dehydrogenase [Brockia lithotrophica]
MYQTGYAIYVEDFIFLWHAALSGVEVQESGNASTHSRTSTSRAMRVQGEGGTLMLEAFAKRAARFARVAAEQAETIVGRPFRLVLTNAGYAFPNGANTRGALDELLRLPELSLGTETLLDVHTAADKPLWFFFVGTDGRRGAFLRVRDAAWERDADGELRPEEILSEETETVELTAEALRGSGATFGRFGGAFFSVVSIAYLALHGAPPELLRAAQFHDHLCPGVTSGYLIATYLKRHLPLRSPDERYVILSLPPWCKDDALQILLNTTPGKSGLYVIPLNERSKGRLRPEARTLAGVYFRVPREGSPAEGLILGFRWEEAYRLLGIPREAEAFRLENLLALDLLFAEYLDRPETFVHTLREISLPEGTRPEDLVQPGTDVLAALNLADPL